MDSLFTFTQIYIFDRCIHKQFCITFVIEQTSQPKLDVFQELLSKHPGVFHPSRTPKSLLVHWQLLKQYYLLDDQSGKLPLVIHYVLMNTFCTCTFVLHIKLWIKLWVLVNIQANLFGIWNIVKIFVRTNIKRLKQNKLY